MSVTVALSENVAPGIFPRIKTKFWKRIPSILAVPVSRPGLLRFCTFSHVTQSRSSGVPRATSCSSDFPSSFPAFA